MSYTPKKVFIIENNCYNEITYEELCNCCQNDEVYKNKFFIPLHGMLMEVSEEFYYDFYKDKRRQKYLDEQSLNNNDLSYDMLTTDDFNGEDILCSQDMDVDLQLEHKYLLENLRKAILKLTDEEQLLLDRYYY